MMNRKFMFLIPVTSFIIAGASFAGCMGCGSNSTNGNSTSTNNSTSTSLSTSLTPSTSLSTSNSTSMSNSTSNSMSNDLLPSDSTSTSMTNSTSTTRQRVRMMFVMQEEFDEDKNEEDNSADFSKKDGMSGKHHRRRKCHKCPTQDESNMTSAEQSN